ncbi:MAG: DUF6941 family protein [Acidimicrobiales bacterium]
MGSVQAAVLCDFAQVREGLLTIVSGGITTLYRSEFPSGLDCYLALVFELPVFDLDGDHAFSVKVTEVDTATVVGAIDGNLHPGALVEQSVGEVLFPAALDLSPLVVTGPGRYDLSVSLDGEPAQRLTLYVLAGAPLGL